MPYIGRGSDFGVRSVFHFLASNGDTSVSGADADGKNLNFSDGNFIDVYLNGVRLKSGEDYNTATANTVAGLSALNANDEVNIVVYDTFTVADTVKASEGGTFAGAVAVTATTASSSATTGALTVSGGAGIAADLSVGDDLRLISDSAVLSFGADSDTTLTHTDGSGLTLNSTNKLMFGDTGTFIHQSADGVLDLVSDTELELNATTIDVNGKIDLAGGSLEGGVVINEDSADVDFRVESNGNTHALFVDAGNGHVNINTDTDLGSDLNINGEVTIANANSGIIMVENAADAFGSNFTMRKSRNTTLNAHTVVQDDDALGTISFQGSDGDEFITGSSISSKVDFTPGNDDLGARLEVAISRDGTKTTAVNTLFHSFNSTDNTKLQGVAVGYNASGGNYASRDGGIHVGAHRYYHVGMVVEDYDSATQYAGTAIQFYRNNSNVGSITTSGSSTAYNTSSDYRLKKEIADLDTSLGIETIKKLKPRKYKWVNNDTHFDHGFVAHEVQDAIANASDIGIVLGQKDETEVAKYAVLDASGNVIAQNVSEEKWEKGKLPTKDVDGTELAAKYPSDSTWKETTTKPKYQGIDYGRFTPILVKGLQEAVTRIETLETKVKALEGG